MIALLLTERIPYPDSDGQPLADNTLQFDWITTLKWGCETLFKDRPDVFVAGDHLIYPVDDEDNVIQLAPDVYVAFGRPKHHRGSYKVWEEGGVFPQVVFEVWSPSNRQQQMLAKLQAYEEYGAEEYYLIYPEHPAFVEGWIREEDKLVSIPDIKTWVSPRLGIRFEIRKGNLNVIRPDGTKFLSYLEIDKRLTTAEHRAEAEAKRAEAEAKRAERLAAKLRELGLDPDAS